MFDTVKLSTIFLRAPDESKLFEKGFRKEFDKWTGQFNKYVLNGPKGSHEPRLTIVWNEYNSNWRGYAEVSIGAWLTGSNHCLPGESDLDSFFCNLSQFVNVKTGLVFDACNCRVARVDFARDFQMDESKVIPLLLKLKNLSFPKYTTRFFDNTTVYFVGKGQRPYKLYRVYSKEHEMLAKNRPTQFVQEARGVLRLEIEHKNRAVSDLAESLQLPANKARYILSKTAHEQVITKAVEKLQLLSLISEEPNVIVRLGENFQSAAFLKFVGHLFLVKEFGPNYHELSFIPVSKSTVKKLQYVGKKLRVFTYE